MYSSHPSVCSLPRCTLINIHNPRARIPFHSPSRIPINQSIHARIRTRSAPQRVARVSGPKSPAASLRQSPTVAVAAPLLFLQFVRRPLLHAPPLLPLLLCSCAASLSRPRYHAFLLGRCVLRASLCDRRLGFAFVPSDQRARRMAHGTPLPLSNLSVSLTRHSSVNLHTSVRSLSRET